METINRIRMEKQDYTALLEVQAPAHAVFKAINNVAGWWVENLEGHSDKMNGVFTIRFNADNFTEHKIIEFIPGKKVVWLVTDCYLQWLRDKHEWTNTKMSFELRPTGEATQLTFTHIGLVPEVECYDMCVKGWDQYVKGSLVKLIMEGEGEAQKKK